MNTAEHFVWQDASNRPDDATRDGVAVDARVLRLAVVELSGAGRLGSLGRLLVLRGSVAWRRWRLRAWGARDVRAFAFFPELDSPTVVYELSGRAQLYVESHILPAQSSLPAPIRRLLAAFVGCDPGVGAVVVVGRKSDDAGTR